MHSPAIKIILQNLLGSKNPSSEFPQPILQVTYASLVYNDIDYRLKDYTAATQTQHEPGEAEVDSVAKLRLSDTVHWIHALLQDEHLHDLVSSNKLSEGHIVRLTNYEVIKQSRQREGDTDENGDKIRSSPANKRRCRSPVGNGFAVKPIYGGGETELPCSCLLIRGLEILSPKNLKKEERDKVEEEEMMKSKKEVVKSEVKVPIVPPLGMVMKPLSQRAVSKVLSPPRFLSQKKTSNNKDSDLSSSSASNPAFISSSIPGPQNNPISWTDRRMTFGQLETAAHGTRASFLAVLLCRRHPYDSKSLDGTKQDWYLWDPTSKLLPPTPLPSTAASTPSTLLHRRRKTILSVWRDQSKFQPKPGTILALRNLTIDKNWNDTPLHQQVCKEMLGDKHWDERVGPPVKLVKVPRGMGHGNINAFATTPADWFLIDARGVQGYEALKEWWEGAGGGKWEWEEERRVDEALKRQVARLRDVEIAKIAKMRGVAGGGGGAGEVEVGGKRKREVQAAEDDYAGMDMDDLETEKLMMEELKRDRNFGNG
ncbi:hypothetical protein L873DRAFT_1845419 [Choiromyces venosus 120613-1]|uniref:Uncharacterized protein n=1 Tax=Choiromyces venosus 120613-1 TaxID=1336337 RepID=A0A3N4JRW2_9PEZI|nr:hypothetical protein L873DRAFT_1845419 [Choiromyces venosus 120613-1]